MQNAAGALVEALEDDDKSSETGGQARQRKMFIPSIPSANLGAQCLQRLQGFFGKSPAPEGYAGLQESHTEESVTVLKSRRTHLGAARVLCLIPRDWAGPRLASSVPAAHMITSHHIASKAHHSHITVPLGHGQLLV